MRDVLMILVHAAWFFLGVAYGWHGARRTQGGGGEAVSALRWWCVCEECESEYEAHALEMPPHVCGECRARYDDESEEGREG